MASVPLFNREGKQIGDLSLPDSIFGVEFNEPLVHQAIVTEEANQRVGTAQTKERGDVRGGGRKPFRQKGTGRARQGTIRAPHFRKGGTVFGPHPRDYRKSFPVKMRRKAIRCALSQKVADGAVIALDALSFEAPKTREAVALIKALGLGDARRTLVIIPEYNATILKSVRNLPEVELRFAPNFSVRDAMTARKIVLVKGAEDKMAAAWAPVAEEAAA